MGWKNIAEWAIVLSGCISSSVRADPAEHRGGSNYFFYRSDGCDHEKYGVIHQYDLAHDAIDSQLATMYAGGQRRLRLPIFFGHGLNSGILMDSAGGDFSPRFRSNIASLLATIKRIGFEEVEISFHPQGPNRPWKWRDWDESLYQENWKLITNLRPILVASGLLYRIDLMNEGIPAPDQTNLLRSDQRLWADYTHRFGKKDTVGFSIIPKEARVRGLPEVYGHNPPDVFDIHPYDDAAENLAKADAIMKEQGLGRNPWIIGESFYNDRAEADAIEQFARATDRRILYVLQWPLGREHRCQGGGDVPLDFEQYEEAGF